MSAGILVGIVVPGVLLAALGLAVFCYRRHRLGPDVMARTLSNRFEDREWGRTGHERLTVPAPTPAFG